MEPGGWILMILSVGTVVSLFSWCLWKVLFRTADDTPEHLHGGLDIDTKDLDESESSRSEQRPNKNPGP